MVKRLLISSILGVVSVAAQLPEFDLIGFDADRVQLAESGLLTIDAPVTETLSAQAHDFVVFELSGLNHADEQDLVDVASAYTLAADYVEFQPEIDNVDTAEAVKLEVSDTIEATAVAYGIEVETDVDGVPTVQSSILNIEESIGVATTAKELDVDYSVTDIKATQTTALQVEDAIGVIDAGVSVFGLSPTLHPLFVNEHSGLWETELGQFVDEPSWDLPALVLPSRVHAVAPHINLVMRGQEALKARMLEAAEAGVNVTIIPYRLGYEVQPVVDMITWSGDHFETVLLGFSANRPWPSPADLRQDLDRLLDGVDGVITAWVSSVDVAGVFAPHQEDTSRFDTWRYMTRWVGYEATTRQVPVIGFRKIDVHGTWELPSRPGGRSGGVFDYTPDGLSAYIYAHVHPFEYGMMIPSRDVISERKRHNYPAKPALLGPFYFRGEDPGAGMLEDSQVRRLVNIYKGLGYAVVEKWIR